VRDNRKEKGGGGQKALRRRGGRDRRTYAPLYNAGPFAASRFSIRRERKVRAVGVTERRGAGASQGANLPPRASLESRVIVAKWGHKIEILDDIS